MAATAHPFVARPIAWDRHGLAADPQPDPSVDRHSAWRRPEWHGPQQPSPRGLMGWPAQLDSRRYSGTGGNLPIAKHLSGGAPSMAKARADGSQQPGPGCILGRPTQLDAGGTGTGTGWQPAYSQATQWTGTQYGEGQAVWAPAAGTMGTVGPAQLDPEPAGHPGSVEINS